MLVYPHSARNRLLTCFASRFASRCRIVPFLYINTYEVEQAIERFHNPANIVIGVKCILPVI